ncbi:helix-turn-helix domain-containing protein [Nocardiopsis alba]|uniref:Helix-turn-helix domain-containing protein n=1 Tax=Nocardiopsis alba TaxID=53437 RepID=A0A7K2IZH1_9ACTN|nr:AraC family transcriptional regulator [Nocardiopsis alba]MYR35380.1 helix-turn-helix domain-containing protein [Nocardiopsis alba]
MRTASPLELHRLDVPAPQTLPFSIGTFDTIGPLSRAPFPHRHTFHEIVYVTAGTGEHVIDLHSRPIDPPNLGILTAGQVHHWDRAHGVDGRVLLLEDSFLLDRPGDRDLLRRLAEERPWQTPTPDTAAQIGDILDEMQREFHARRTGMASILRAYLHILLTRAARSFDREPAPAPPATDTPGARFLRLLDDPATATGMTVAQAAAELGLTPGHLAESVRKSTGRTPGELLRAARTLEAKRLLSGTDLTVAAIARAVGFNDPAYFCRFFRRETGTSPGAFRHHTHTTPAESKEPPGKHHAHRDPSIAHPTNGT